MTGRRPLRPPTRPELVRFIRAEPDGPRRSQLEDWYWAKAVDRYGKRRAAAYRWEYEWLRAHRTSLKSDGSELAA